MNIITVKQLKDLCDQQIAKGNGDKEILISQDDEGNSYHSLFYGFMDSLDSIKECKEFSGFHDDNKPEDVVILG